MLRLVERIIHEAGGPIGRATTWVRGRPRTRDTPRSIHPWFFPTHYHDPLRVPLALPWAVCGMVWAAVSRCGGGHTHLVMGIITVFTSPRLGGDTLHGILRPLGRQRPVPVPASPRGFWDGILSYWYLGFELRKYGIMGSCSLGCCSRRVPLFCLGFWGCDRVA